RLDAEGRRYLDVIVKNVNKMGQLIDDLLAFSKLGRKQIQLAPIDVQELVADVLAELHDARDGRNVDVQVGALPPCHGDAPMIRQVLTNLITNALKYSRGRDPAVVRIDATSTAEETIYRVADNGVGFDMRYVDKLFGVFQRLHSSAEFEGTGVGLALVQRIVHRHGGRVWAEGRPDA